MFPHFGHIDLVASPRTPLRLFTFHPLVLVMGIVSRTSTQTLIFFIYHLSATISLKKPHARQANLK